MKSNTQDGPNATSARVGHTMPIGDVFNLSMNTQRVIAAADASFKRVEARPRPSQVFPSDLSQAVTLRADWRKEVTVGDQTAYEDDCPCCGGGERCYTGPKGASFDERTKDEHWIDCPCVELARRVERVTLLGLALPLHRATWENTDKEGWPSAREEQIRGWVASWTPRQQGFFFLGETGVGKTHIAALMASGLAARGVRVAWIDWPSMLTQVDTGFRTRRSSISDFYQQHVRPFDVVVFDDIGQGDDPRAAWTKHLYEELLGARAESFKTTILTTNYNFEVLEEEISHRVLSRLSRIVRFAPIKGIDRRKFKAGEEF